MAMEKLKFFNDVEQEYHFDFQSLLYVFIWIITFCDGPYGQKRKHFKYKHATVAIWNGRNASESWLNTNTIYANKMTMTTNGDNFANSVKSQFSSFFAPLFPLVERLRELVCPTVLDDNNIKLTVRTLKKFEGDEDRHLYIELLRSLPLSHELRKDRSLAFMEEFINILRDAKRTLGSEHSHPLPRPLIKGKKPAGLVHLARRTPYASRRRRFHDPVASSSSQIPNLKDIASAKALKSAKHHFTFVDHRRSTAILGSQQRPS